MATATVISLEPFLEATQPSLNKQDTAASKLPPPPPRPAAAAGSVPKSDPAGSDRDTVEQRQKTDVTIHRKSSGQDHQAGWYNDTKCRRNDEMHTSHNKMKTKPLSSVGALVSSLPGKRLLLQPMGNVRTAQRPLCRPTVQA